MILTGPEISREVSAGRIEIVPFNSDRLNPVSYNYSLGEAILTLEGEKILIPEAGHLIRPGRLYLGRTVEAVGSSFYVPEMFGRSSMGRLGLYVNLSSTMGQLGPAHRWTLELACVQPIRIYPGMIIGQVSFWVPTGDLSLYEGPYTDSDDPMHCVDRAFLRKGACT